MTDTEAAVLEILSDVLYDRDPSGLALDTALIDAGMLDSLALLRIVGRSEEHFDIVIPNDQILPEHFDSVRAIAKLIDRVRDGARPRD